LGSLYRQIAEKIWSYDSHKRAWEFYVWEVLKDEDLMKVFQWICDANKKEKDS
jgi:hypothetical protein